MCVPMNFLILEMKGCLLNLRKFVSYLAIAFKILHHAFLSCFSILPRNRAYYIVYWTLWFLATNLNTAGACEHYYSFYQVTDPAIFFIYYRISAAKIYSLYIGHVFVSCLKPTVYASKCKRLSTFCIQVFWCFSILPEWFLMFVAKKT
jgi:hypothetical protein